MERRHPDNDEHFRSTYLRGIWDGFWWATVTVTTVGYGDKAPRSVLGRSVALLGMLSSLFLVGAFVSQVSAVLNDSRTKAPFTSLQDLGDRSVGVVGGSSFAAYIESEGVEAMPYPSQAALFQAVEDGQIDVIVTNPYALSAIGPAHDVTATGSLLYEEFETFGLAQGSPWREPVNQVLADLQASGEIAEIIDRWQN